MIKVYDGENPTDYTFSKEVFEKLGERRLFSRDEYFARSCEVMEYAGWIVSGGFKYSLTSSDGNNRVIGFSLDDSILSESYHNSLFDRINNLLNLWRITLKKGKNSSKIEKSIIVRKLTYD